MSTTILENVPLGENESGEYKVWSKSQKENGITWRLEYLEYYINWKHVAERCYWFFLQNTLFLLPKRS